MQEIPGGSCDHGDKESRKQRANYCSECGTRLVWRSREGGAEVKECPTCN